ncbi:hypothetical protein ACFXTN_026087 [Malus domestica]
MEESTRGTEKESKGEDRTCREIRGELKKKEEDTKKKEVVRRSEGGTGGEGTESWERKAALAAGESEDAALGNT